MVNIASVLVLSGVTLTLGLITATPIPKPVCDSSKRVSVRYASSSQRIYVESIDGTRGGCTSLTHIYNNLKDKKALYPLESPGEWFLASELYILDGITLEVHGTVSGGDCDYLKLKSDDEGHVYIRAHGGSMDFVDTKVTSWDTTSNKVDTNYDNGRAYLSAISEVIADPSDTCKGIAKNNMGEARMDIEGSEIAYLGYKASESWGISWKLRGLCNDNSNEKNYEGIAVYGDIRNCEIHNLYFGHYSYGAAGSVIIGNKFYNHVGYCIDPHNRSSDLIIADNEMYGCGDHGAIFSKFCKNVVVRNNHIHGNNGVGIFPHYVSHGSVITGNLVEDNRDSGIAFLESSDGLVYNNVVVRNQHGIRFSVGSRNNVVLENIFMDNRGYDVYTYEGGDAVVEAPDGNPTNNVLFGNNFSGNAEGFRFDDSAYSQFVKNNVKDAMYFELRDTSGLLVEHNEFPDGMAFVVKDSCIEDSTSVPCGHSRITPFTTEDSDSILKGVKTSTVAPSVVPSFVPSFVPSVVPSVVPSAVPSLVPSVVSSVVPSLLPSVVSSVVPSGVPSAMPTQVLRGVDFSSSMDTSVPTLSPTVPSEYDVFSDPPTSSPSFSPSSSPSDHNVSNEGAFSAGNSIGKSISGVLIAVGVVTVCHGIVHNFELHHH